MKKFIYDTRAELTKPITYKSAGGTFNNKPAYWITSELSNKRTLVTVTENTLSKWIKLGYVTILEE